MKARRDPSSPDRHVLVRRRGSLMKKGSFFLPTGWKFCPTPSIGQPKCSVGDEGQRSHREVV